LKLLLDAMYSSQIAPLLRERGHDAVSATERDDLRAISDAGLVAFARDEQRVLVTHNVRDFAPLVAAAMADAPPLLGVVFTSDKSLPRSKRTTPRYVDLLDALASEDRLAGGVVWLSAS